MIESNVPQDQVCIDHYYHEGAGWTFLGVFEGKTDLWIECNGGFKYIYARTPNPHDDYPYDECAGLDEFTNEFQYELTGDFVRAFKEARLRYLKFRDGDPNYKCTDPSVSPGCRR